MKAVNQNLEKFQNQSQTIPISNEISVYKGGLTVKGMIRAVELLEKAFPKMPSDMHEILKDRFKANGFSDERMLDSINHVIDNYPGWDKLPNIANFVQFDRTVKLYTFNEVCEKNLWNEVIWVKVNGQGLFVKSWELPLIKHLVEEIQEKKQNPKIEEPDPTPEEHRIACEAQLEKMEHISVEEKNNLKELINAEQWYAFWFTKGQLDHKYKLRTDNEK